MNVSFLSIDDEKNKVSFKTSVNFCENKYIFNDETTKDTTIEVEILGSCVRLIRRGNILMYILFDLHNITSGSYENQEGLKFDFDIKTTKLELTNTKIRIDYEMIIEKEVISEHKLSLLFN